MMYETLISAALAAREKAYTPYSKFKVGAALMTAEGKIYTGCNIENAAFSPTCCAERTAFFKAVSEGEKNFSAIAVVGGQEGKPLDYCPPCGVCRQVMVEFCDTASFIVVLAKDEYDYKTFTLNEILPISFK